MILSDQSILNKLDEGTIVIQPFAKSSLGSNSYDVHLGNKLAEYKTETLDAKCDNAVEYTTIPEEGYTLYPGRLYLGVTQEYTETLDTVPFLEGKSSTGRLGINIHATAGKGDVGFCGYWTLEITVAKPVRVYVGMPIGQLIYHEVKGEVINPYNLKDSAKYSGQGGKPVPSRMWMNKF